MQSSCFFVLQYLKSITSITGGIVGSDFLLSQSFSKPEQISFSLVFFRMRVPGSRHIDSLLVQSLGILFYYCIGKSSFDYFTDTEKRFL